MQIKTIKLQEMVSKAIKGVGNNKLIPLTSLMAIEVKDGECTITTTDATNYLFIRSKVETEDFYVVVEADTFSKLVARLTNDTISMEVRDNTLAITCGRGNYDIALPLDEDGGMVKFPNPCEDYGDNIGTFSRATIMNVLNALKPSLALTMERPCYTAYYVGKDSIIATDIEQISAIDVEALSTPLLISSEMMNLLDVAESDMEVFVKDNKVTCVSSGCVVYGATVAGIENYAVEPIKGLISKAFPSMVRLPKNELLQILDRIALFIDAFDEGLIAMQFTHDGLIISNKQSSGVDVVEYMESDNFADYTININVNMLRAHIKAQADDCVELWYGDPASIKIVDGELTSIIALLLTE